MLAYLPYFGGYMFEIGNNTATVAVIGLIIFFLIYIIDRFGVDNND